MRFGGLERFDVAADRRQRAVGLVDAVAQLRGNAERDVHFVHGQRAQERHHLGVERIGDGNGERAVGEHERQHVVAVRVGRVDERGRGRLRRRVAQVDDRNVELFAQRARDVFFADDATLDEERAEALPVRVLRALLERVAGDDAGVHEQVAEASARLGDREVGHEGCVASDRSVGHPARAASPRHRCRPDATRTPTVAELARPTAINILVCSQSHASGAPYFAPMRETVAS